MAGYFEEHPLVAALTFVAAYVACRLAEKAALEAKRRFTGWRMNPLGWL